MKVVVKLEIFQQKEKRFARKATEKSSKFIFIKIYCFYCYCKIMKISGIFDGWSGLIVEVRMPPGDRVSL